MDPKKITQGARQAPVREEQKHNLAAMGTNIKDEGHAWGPDNGNNTFSWSGQAARVGWPINYTSWTSQQLPYSIASLSKDTGTSRAEASYARCSLAELKEIKDKIFW